MIYLVFILKIQAYKSKQIGRISRNFKNLMRNLREFSGIFGNFREFLGIFREFPGINLWTRTGLLPIHLVFHWFLTFFQLNQHDGYKNQLTYTSDVGGIFWWFFVIFRYFSWFFGIFQYFSVFFGIFRYFSVFLAFFAFLSIFVNFWFFLNATIPELFIFQTIFVNFVFFHTFWCFRVF